MTRTTASLQWGPSTYFSTASPFHESSLKDTLDHLNFNLHPNTVKVQTMRDTNLSTTTIGLSLPVSTISPFHIMRADDTIIPKFST